MPKENLSNKSFPNKVITILKENSGKFLSSRALAEIIFDRDKDLVKRRRKKGRDDEAVIRQISAEVSSYKLKFEETPSIDVLVGPIRLSFNPELEEKQPSSYTKKSNKEEEKLYNLLRQYLDSIKIHSMEIDANTSKKERNASGDNKNLHPDIVGIKYPYEHWEDKIKRLTANLSKKKIYLYSFEVKDGIIRKKDIRKGPYLQAVMNSSWANFGYLVAPEIDSKAVDEIRILVNSLNIGFIKLNIEDPLESRIVIPAKERLEVDWNIVNRIASQNSDFLKYIQQIEHIYETTGKIRWGGDWDIKED